MELGLCGRIGNAQRRASGATHRGTVKPSNEPRIGSANLLRYFQRPRSLHIRTSRFITVRGATPIPPCASRTIRSKSRGRYASGRTTGIVLDSGDGVTHAVPVFEGFSMPHAIRRVDVAGRDVTEHLQLLLRKAGHHLHTTAEREVVRSIKEKNCYIALNPHKEEKETTSRTEAFRLPDGNTIALGSERFRAPEILFNPEIIGLEDAGVHQVVVDSINRVDMDLRKSLYSNIVLSGGTTLCTGYGDRLLNEVKRMKDGKIKIYAPPERKYSTWIGGSILAGLNTFKKMWVSSEEYQEDPDIIHKKFGF